MVVIALAFVAARESHGTTARGIGPLSNIVFTGLVDGWTGSMESGVYWLENTAGDPSDIRYFYTAREQGAGADRSVGVDVLTAHMPPEGRAGLLYGYRDSPRFYFLITVSGKGDLEVFKRDDQGINLMISTSLGAANAGSVRIEVREKGRELSLFADGSPLGSLQNDRIGGGQVGIAAVGAGRFGFTNYEQSSSPQGNAQASARIAFTEAPDPQEVRAKPMVPTNYIEYMDPKLRIAQHRAPFPEGWRYDTNPSDQLLLTGPGGTKVFQTGSGQYFYSDDGFARQSAQMAGQRIAPVLPLERFLEQQFSPYMGQRGYRLVGSFPLPRIVDFMDLFAAGMPQGMSQRRFEVMGAEWEGSDGSRAYTQLTLTQLLSPRNGQAPLITWSVSALELYAARERYENDRDALMYASEHTEMNPRWQIAKNEELLRNIRASTQYWDERTRESHIQHIGRMNAILARGQASASVAKINSDILDISHAGYLKRSDMVSAGQARTVDMIAGKSVIANPSTGEHYRVDAGSRNYWVNAEGKYFRTDDSLYDPRTDIQISNQQWQRFEVVR